ncbi:MAG TPA: acetolactate synthase 3 large subunit [Stellaceae bacterium]|jgi:acetolactate synthase-1/2/3 large subunit|nr:acetolactate synthase 3 large subunit [Stellaceae bacterium]
MSAEPICGADIVIKALVDQGVDVVFGYPGGAVLPIYDSLFKQNALRHILVRQEGGAVHAAEGYARSTGRVGVVLVTSGPGATNAVTGLTDALMDSVPVVCLTGQVPTHLIGNDAFQEADTTGITRPCTKHNYLVKDANELARIMHEAFYVAKSGRPGPVVVDLPKDVLFALGRYSGPEQGRHKTYRPQLDADPARIEEAAALIAAAKKPLFYGGGGIVNSGPEACARFAELVRMVDAPCTLTLMGLGAFPASDPHFLGMVGMHGLYESNMAMHDCDLMIAVGSRFDDRVTGRLNAFAPNSKKIHIDIDPSSLNKNVRIDVPLLGDCGRVLTALTSAVKKQKKSDGAARKAWWREIDQWRGRDCLRYDHTKPDVIKPQYALERLYELVKDRNPYITTEVGQHQMWAAQFFKFEEPYHWMTSGGLGTMGYGLPAAVGVQVAHPDALVIDIAGEASILMNIQELSTIAQYRLPVKAFILNNQYMGMVRQWQELLHGARYSETYSAALPDFVKLADAFGGKGMRVTKPAELDDAIRAMIDHPGAFVLDVAVDEMENCFPMIPSGAAHNEMLLGPADKAGSPVSEEGMVLV